LNGVLIFITSLLGLKHIGHIEKLLLVRGKNEWRSL
jgi:hypothetical protein